MGLVGCADVARLALVPDATCGKQHATIGRLNLDRHIDFMARGVHVGGEVIDAPPQGRQRASALSGSLGRRGQVFAPPTPVDLALRVGWHRAPDELRGRRQPKLSSPCYPALLLIRGQADVKLRTLLLWHTKGAVYNVCTGHMCSSVAVAGQRAPIV